MRFFLFSTSPRKYPSVKSQQHQDHDPPESDSTPSLTDETSTPIQAPPLLPSLSSTSAVVEAPFSRSTSTIFASANNSISSTATGRTTLINGSSTASSSDDLAASGLRNRSQRTPHARAAGTPPLVPALPNQARGIAEFLARLEYNHHSSESLDWFNVILAQIINQYRSDARANGRLATVLSDVLNGPKKPDFLDEIKLTELSTGEDFPIFSNCRIHKRSQPSSSANGVSSQVVSTGSPDVVAEMDVDLSDTITMGIETRLLLRQPRLFSTVMPVSLVVSIVRFSARLILRISRVTVDPPATENASAEDGSTSEQASQKNTMLVLRISCHPDFTLEVAVKSLLGSRSMLHDMPRIGHIIEGQLRKWFSDNFVDPGYKQVVLFRYQTEKKEEPPR